MNSDVFLTLATAPIGTAASASSHLGWALAGAAAASAVAGGIALVVRKRRNLAMLRLARTIEQLGEPGPAPKVDGAAPTFVPASVLPLVAATRRAARTIETREQAHASRLRELEAILHSTANGFIAIDPQQRLLDLNSAAATMLGVAQQAVRGRMLPEVARHPALNRFVREAIERSEASEAQLELEGLTPRSVRATAEPLRDASGRQVGALVSLQDVTRLRQLESLRSDFVSNVSHELRTPITAIKGYVETLLQIGTDDPAQARRFLDIVHRNTVRLASLVEDLLALASLEQVGHDQRSPIEVESVAATTIIDHVLDELAPRSAGRNIAMACSIEPGLVVLANRILAEQALANLVSNAIRYAPRGSRVEISARALDADFAEFAVRDEGPGIAPAHLDRIFERFYRIDRARSRAQHADGGGTGLGLAIAKHIAHAHGGRIAVDSMVGVGSTFRLALRKAATAPPSEASATDPSESA